MPSDTPPEVERIHLRMMREAGQLRRSTIASRISTTVLRRARQAIAQAHPELSATEHDLMFIRIHHGPDLADRVRAYLANRPRA